MNFDLERLSTVRFRFNILQSIEELVLYLYVYRHNVQGAMYVQQMQHVFLCMSFHLP